MNLFILFSVLLLNNALPGLSFPTEATNCAENATLSRECNTSENATLCKSSCDNSTVINDNVNLTNQVCQPNEVRLESCNRCKCAANGIGWFCTRRACSPSSHQRQQRRAESNCTPGASWSDGCNTCYCSESGVPYCTERLCNRRKKRSQSEDNGPSIIRPGHGLGLGNTQRCTPGQQWKHVCNDCFCTETGIAACTLRGCFPNSRVGPPQITIIHPRKNFTHPSNPIASD